MKYKIVNSRSSALWTAVTTHPPNFLAALSVRRQAWEYTVGNWDKIIPESGSGIEVTAWKGWKYHGERNHSASDFSEVAGSQTV